MRIALSTMTAQHERFEDGADFARFAVESGYDGIEISHSTSTAKLRQIVEARLLPVVSVHQPAPWERSLDGTPNCDLNLASLDDAHRAEALAYAKRSILLASELGASAVVLHLGHVELASDALSLDTEVRRRFNESGVVDPPLVADALAQRTEIAEPFLASARESLRELATTAAPLGIVLGVESRINLLEIPLASELPYLLEGLDPDLAGYWHDVGHAEVLHRLGYCDLASWFGQPGVRCAGAHVHDVRGILDHRAPGLGDVDFAWHLTRLDHLEWLTLEINQYEPDEAVVAAPALLRSIAT